MKAIKLAKREYLEKFYDLYSEDYEKVGSIQGFGVYLYKIKVFNKPWFYLVDEDNGQVVVSMPLSRREKFGHVFFHPDYTITDFRYRGNGFALKLYTFLIKNGMVIQAGESQSDGSQKLWLKLAKRSDIEIWCCYKGRWDRAYANDGLCRIDSDICDPYSDTCTTIAIKKEN
jgi:hypothetical protein